ncbi:MAG: hypothetical protein HOP02_11830 [Methylococcaceae bacterium]|nr:hypothetical protein [Methylococcaceae bacterium]
MGIEIYNVNSIYYYTVVVVYAIHEITSRQQVNTVKHILSTGNMPNQVGIQMFQNITKKLPDYKDVPAKPKYRHSGRDCWNDVVTEASL